MRAQREDCDELEELPAIQKLDRWTRAAVESSAAFSIKRLARDPLFERWLSQGQEVATNKQDARSKRCELDTGRSGMPRQVPPVNLRYPLHLTLSCSLRWLGAGGQPRQPVLKHASTVASDIQKGKAEDGRHVQVAAVPGAALAHTRGSLHFLFGPAPAPTITAPSHPTPLPTKGHPAETPTFPLLSPRRTVSPRHACLARGHPSTPLSTSLHDSCASLQAATAKQEHPRRTTAGPDEALPPTHARMQCRATCRSTCRRYLAVRSCRR